MRAAEIAREVNQRRLYARKDGLPVPANQISARANNYPQLFLKRGQTIDLVGQVAKIEQSVQVVGTAIPKRAVDPVWPISDSAFQEVGTIADLTTMGLPDVAWLGRCGLYAVVVPDGYEATFLDVDVASRAGNVTAPWSRERLAAKWVEGARVVYIGLAGRDKARSLRARLRDLLCHCSGKTTDHGPHRGGEILWQLGGYPNFRVVAFPTGDPPVPRQMEEGLLQSFRERFGMLPFANRQG